MQGKITLITPPDFFENDNLSILFVNLSEKDQDTVSKFLSNLNFNENINFYLFNQDVNVAWLLYAASRCDYKFIELDPKFNILNTLGGYLLSKSNTFYHTSDKNLVSIYSHINSNKITDITQFLERIFNV